MNEEKALQIINDLRNEKIREYLVEKKDFMTFRTVLMAQEDKKNFVGEAQKGGNVIYRYVVQK